MHSAPLLIAFAAGLASAASCKSDVEIESINFNSDCSPANKNVIVSKSLGGNLVLSGLKEIKGDLIITNATQLTGLSSADLATIGGKLKLQNLNIMQEIDLSALKEIRNIDIVNLPILSKLAFGSSGVTQADEIIIANTQLSDLSNLKLKSVDTFEITDNQSLKKFESDATNITTKFIARANGKDMEIKMNKLKKSGEIQLTNIKSFEAPELTEAGSIQLETNENIDELKMPKLTDISTSLTINNNNNLGNVSFPKLTKVGDMTIQNNTKMLDISGFPELQYVSSAILLLGDFEKVEMPKLKLVNGTVKVSSTTDIESFCKFFDDASDDKMILGEEKCTWDNEKANEGNVDAGTSKDGPGSSKDDSKSEDDEGAAGSLRASFAMLGLALVAGLTQLL
jgi:hypothetical protein